MQGGMFDDFLSHFMCCCCALVQEWREVEIRGIQGKTKLYVLGPILIPFLFITILEGSFPLSTASSF